MHRIVLFTLLAAACHDHTVSNPPLPSGDFAVVLTSGGFGAGGAVNTVRLSDMTVTKAIDTTIDQDSQIRVVGGKAYVLGRGPGTLRIYDIKSWAQPVEIPTGDATADHAGSLPEDVLVVGANKLYVTMGLNDSAHAIGVIDPADTSGVKKWIALPAAAGDSGGPEPFLMYGCGGKAYVLMGDYDSMTFQPVGNSRIAVVDTATDTLEGFFTLSFRGPTAIAAASADCHDVYVAQSGPYGKLPDGTGGIEHVDLLQKKALGTVLSDNQLQGRPNTLTLASATLAFSSIYFDPQPDPTTGQTILSSTKTIAFDPTTGKVIGDVLGKAVFAAFVAVSPNRQLLVGVDSYPGSLSDGKLPSGLYVGKADGTAMPTTPIDLGQNPYAIAFQ
jgi:hypothetical protein